VKLRPGNAQHQGARESQQDSFGFSDLENRAFTAHAGFLGAVADGMGGLEQGGLAASTAIRALLESYGAKRTDEAIGAALLRSVEAANRAVFALTRERDDVISLGTTVTAAVVDRACLHWISVGDSRVYLWRDGEIAQVTVDHRYGAELRARAAAGRISFADAMSDPEREALTSHLGVPALSLIDRSCRPLPLFFGDRIVLCSDGLYRGLTEAELGDLLAGTPQEACEAMVARTLDKAFPHQDNVTVLVIAVEDDDVSGGVTVLDSRRPAGSR
jgi:protein phosphatase